MPVAVRWVLAIVLGLVLVMSLAIGGAVAAIYEGGTLAVDVRGRDGGAKIAVGVPAGLANLAIALVPSNALPVEEVAPIAEELRPYRPVIQAALDELSELPDFVLVEVDSRDEHVLVKKVNRKILVLVESDGSEIKVSIPLTTVRQFFNKLDRLLDQI